MRSTPWAGTSRTPTGISKEELKAAIPCGIGKINVDTDIRLAVTRNFRELFRDHPELKEDARVGRRLEAAGREAGCL